MDFGSALQHLRMGAQVRRTGWNGKGMFIFLVAGSKFVVNRPPLLGIYPEGTEVEYHAHIDMKTADNKIVPWLASQTDVLADDWEFVPGPYANDADPWDIDAAPGHEFGVEHRDSFPVEFPPPDILADVHTHDDHRDHGGTPHDDNDADRIAAEAVFLKTL